MKFSIEFSVMHRYLKSLGCLAPVLQCLGMGFSYPTIGDIWTHLIDDTELERFDFNAVVYGSIAGYLNQSNQYKRSGGPRRLATLPI